MKVFCGSPSQTFCHWVMELHEHCCEMESMMVFCSLSPFMSSSTLFTVLLTNLFFGFFCLSWWRRVSASMFLGAAASCKSRISGFLDCFNMLRVVNWLEIYVSDGKVNFTSSFFNWKIISGICAFRWTKPSFGVLFNNWI